MRSYATFLDMEHFITWCDIPVTDIHRATRFYAAVFDKPLAVDPGPEGFAMTFLPQQETGISGALVQGPGYVPSHTGTVVYLNAFPDLSVFLERAVAAGGKVLQPKTQISEEHGYMAYIEDSEGNKIGLHSKA